MLDRKRVVSYLRVSTKQQGASGLGIEAQRADVDAFCRDHGCRLIKEFPEIESGRRNDRPRLREALARAKASRALLVIARLDRLSRNVAFIANMLESGVEFVACDMPSANRAMMQMTAVMAEEEARAISDRTKKALAAAKARGVLLGASNPACRNLTDDARRRGRLSAVVARRHVRDQTVDAVADEIKALRAEGHGYALIARSLNSDDYRTATGRRWTPMTVWLAAKQIA